MSKHFYASVFSLCLLLAAAGQAYADVDPNGEIATGDPLVPGASWTPYGMEPPQGMPTTPGSGNIPLGTPVGETCPPTTDPWVTTIPVNTAGQTESQACLPYGPDYLSEPGALGPAATPYIPGAPSTPGKAIGMLRTPAGVNASAVVVHVNTNGGLPDGNAPIKRRGGQTTADYGHYGLVRPKGSLVVDFGLSESKNPAVAKKSVPDQDGPFETPTSSNSAYMTYLPNRPNAQATTDLYGVRTLFKGPSNRAQQINALY